MHKTFLKKIPLFIFFLLFFYLCSPSYQPSLNQKHPLQIYANQCDDDIRKAFIGAIKNAKHSIYLKVYSLNDKEVRRVLQRKKREGVHVEIILDKKNNNEYGDLDVQFYEKSWALMHQKILIIDEEKIYLGSANFTTSSMRAHDNIVVALHSNEIATSILAGLGGQFNLKNQKIELYLLPKEKKEAYKKVISLLENAQKKLFLAMFTMTHEELTQKVIESKKRGLEVLCILDSKSAIGVSKLSSNSLSQNDVKVKLHNASLMLHHKMAYIDNSILIMGSANWTKAAFAKNEECILIIYDLNKKQQKKLDNLWHAMKAGSI